MAFHYYTGSDISEQREPAFWRREPRWPIGTFDGPARMAKQEIGNGREGHNKNPGICKENPKNPDRIGQFFNQG